LETLELNGQDERCFTDAGHDAEGNTTIALTDLMTHFPRLSRLGLVFFYFSSTFFSSLVDTTVAGLTVLNLEGSVLSKSDVKLIASQMKNLEQLSVMQSSFNDALMEVFCRWHDSNRSLLQVFRLDATEVTINSVKMLGHTCPKLGSVGTYGPKLTTDQMLLDLAQFRWKTLALVFGLSANVTSQGLCQFFETGGGSQVRKIVVSGPGIAFDRAALQMMLIHCPRLEKLSITAMASVDEACLEVICHHSLPCLSSVLITACPISSAAAMRMAARVPFRLDMRFPSDFSHQAM